jgi:hypothetical protein
MRRDIGLLRELVAGWWRFFYYMRAGFAELSRAHPFVFSAVILLLSIVLGMLLVLLWMLLS